MLFFNWFFYGPLSGPKLNRQGHLYSRFIMLQTAIAMLFFYPIFITTSPWPKVSIPLSCLAQNESGLAKPDPAPQDQEQKRLGFTRLGKLEFIRRPAERLIVLKSLRLDIGPSLPHPVKSCQAHIKD